MEKFLQQRIQISGVTENRKMCAEIGILLNRDPCFCPVDSVSRGFRGEPKPISQGSGKCVFSSVAFLVTAVGVNHQAKKHIQIIGKIKWACADCMLEPYFQHIAKLSWITPSLSLRCSLHERIRCLLRNTGLVDLFLRKFIQFRL